MRLPWFILLFCGSLLPLLTTLAQSPEQSASATFDYDKTLPFNDQSESLSPRKDVKLTGGSFQPLKDRRMDFILAEPVGSVAGRQRRPVVIFQHGGGQSMSNYISEAALLAKAGVVSLITEAPYRRTAEESKQGPNGSALRQHAVDVVISIRRALDWLESRGDIDSARVAYIGHSYGGNAGAILTAVDKRIKTFILVGLVASYSRHVAGNKSDYWGRFRASLSADELTRTIDLLRPTDAELFLPKSSPAPLLFQCARFDMDDVKTDCEVAFKAAGESKVLRWYDVEHQFVDLEASLDRLRWLAAKLKIGAIHEMLKSESGKPWKE